MQLHELMMQLEVEEKPMSFNVSRSFRTRRLCVCPTTQDIRIPLSKKIEISGGIGGRRRAAVPAPPIAYTMAPG